MWHWLEKQCSGLQKKTKSGMYRLFMERPKSILGTGHYLLGEGTIFGGRVTILEFHFWEDRLFKKKSLRGGLRFFEIIS